jgi:hypothetical protein
MKDKAEPATASESHPWLVRIPEVFEAIAPGILQGLGVVPQKRLGTEYHLVRAPFSEAGPLRSAEASLFVRWSLPVEHSWPCHPAKMGGFVEKAAQALFKKFGDRRPQTLLVGQLNPGAPDQYYKNLAVNLRGRALQLFPGLPVQEVEAQEPGAETLFCLVGREGLFAGMQSPREANGFYPGGSRYIAKDTPETISRAGAKIAEALHYLPLYRRPLNQGSRWLELGACPGGMTFELLQRHYQVTAIDVAPLDVRLHQHRGLSFVRSRVEDFTPEPGHSFHAILSDMNGPPQESIAQVIRLSHFLKKHGLIVFTLKLPRVETVEEPLALFRSVVKEAAKAGLRLLARTHLTYNRHEFTLFFESEHDEN